jgi:hypothetical protein
MTCVSSSHATFTPPLAIRVDALDLVGTRGGEAEVVNGRELGEFGDDDETPLREPS